MSGIGSVGYKAVCAYISLIPMQLFEEARMKRFSITYEPMGSYIQSH